jgi:positive regulator of sigma E activity
LLEGPVYFVAVTLFWLVLLAAARMRHDVMLVFCIPAVFVAIVMGFAMGIYAWDTFGTVQALVCPVLAWFGARELERRYDARDFLIAIYLVWVVGLVFATIALGFPDAA